MICEQHGRQSPNRTRDLPGVVSSYVTRALFTARISNVDSVLYDDKKERTFLNRYGCISVAKKLMEGRGKRTVNANDVYERTPLHLAAQQGHDELVEFFLKKGAKIDRYRRRN